MNRWCLILTLVTGLVCTAELSAHGGTYRGPGDTVPPAGGGAAAPTVPAAPAAPAAPSAPGAAAPATPNAPSTPGAVAIPTTTKQPTQAVTSGGDTGPDLTTWEFWWEFNKEPYLNLKARIQSGNISTGESELILGLGQVSTKNNTFAPSDQQIRGAIIPALQRSLEEDDNRDITSSNLIALAKIGRDPNTPALFKPFLSDNNQEISETAALAYGILQYEAAVGDLKALALDQPDGRTMVGKESGVPLRNRAFAVYGLGLVGHASEDPTVKQDIADTLWNALVTDDSALKDIKVACVISLGLLKLENPGEVVDNLSGYLANVENDFLVRAHCPNAMAKLIADAVEPDDARRLAAIDQFLTLLNERNAKTEVRQSCVQALGMLARGDDPTAARIYDAIIQVAEKGRDRQEKNFTAIALAYLGASAPGPMREKVTTYLAQNVTKGSTPYRPWAALGLGVMGFKMAEEGQQLSTTAVRVVSEAFKREKNPSNKAGYAIALGLMRAEDSVPDIRTAMEKSRVADLRGYCAVSLGLMGARDQKDYLTELVKESRRLPDLLRQASIGLGLMNDHRVTDTLLALMKPDDGNSPPLAVLAAVATALGFIGDHRSVNPLTEMLANDKDYTPLARAFSSVALGIVADKEKLPWNSKIGEDLNYRAAVETLVDPQSSTGVLDIL